MKLSLPLARVRSNDVFVLSNNVHTTSASPRSLTKHAPTPPQLVINLHLSLLVSQPAPSPPPDTMLIPPPPLPPLLRIPPQRKRQILHQVPLQMNKILINVMPP